MMMYNSASSYFGSKKRNNTNDAFPLSPLGNPGMAPKKSASSAVSYAGNYYPVVPMQQNQYPNPTSLRAKTIDSADSSPNEESVGGGSVCMSTTDEKSVCSELFHNMESDDRITLMNFLQNAVQVDIAEAARTADILVKNGVGSLPVLSRRLKRNEEFLLDIGIDEMIAQRMVLSLQESYDIQRVSANASSRRTSLNSFSFLSLGTSQRKPSSLYKAAPPTPRSKLMSPKTSSFYSFLGRSGSQNQIVSGVGSLSPHSTVTIHEVAMYYYQAAYCDKAEALQKLLDIAAVDRALLKTNMLDSDVLNLSNLTEVVALGFLMRMFALGQGSLTVDRTVAMSLSKVLFPIFVEELRGETHPDFKTYLQYLLGVCYSEGLGVTKNDIQALHWYKQAAEQGGYSLAQAYLGYYYYTLGMKHLQSTPATPCSTPSAFPSTPCPMTPMTPITPRRYLADNNAQQYFEEAVRWYRLAAEQAYSPAECNLGMCYEHGHGVIRNVFEAMQWYRRAANQSNAIALYNLGYWLEQGIPGLMPPDIDQAIQCYRLSAQANYLLAEYKVGEHCFLQSEYVEAVKWYEQCIAKGRNYAPAQCALGVCYEHGFGVTKNLTLAMHFYSLAAAQDHPNALYYLGYCYFLGYVPDPSQQQQPEQQQQQQQPQRLSLQSGHTSIDSSESSVMSGSEEQPTTHIKKAVELYSRSANLGSVAAANNLGYCYFRGLGVCQDYVEAVRWYSRAAEKGYAPAQYNLGYCYEKSLGISSHTKRTNEMLRWYRAAAAQGNEKAHKALNKFR